MNLQAKLTLGSVLLATLIVSFISAVDLGNLMQLEFQGAVRARRPGEGASPWTR